MSRVHGDDQVVRLNEALYGRAAGVHTRADIARDAVTEIDRLRDRVEALEAAILQANADYDNACLDRPCVPLERLAGMLPDQRVVRCAELQRKDIG